MEGVFLDDLNDLLEEDLGGEGVAMVDDWFIIGAIPTVHYNVCVCVCVKDERVKDERVRVREVKLL